MRNAWLAVLCACGTACGSGDENSDVNATAAFIVHDSAGVEIIGSQRPLWAEGEEWTFCKASSSCC